MTTKNQSRPSCARVKVKVDLLSDFPKRIKIGELYPKEDKDNKDKVYDGEREDDKGKGIDIKGKQNDNEQIFKEHRQKNGFGRGVQQKRQG
ncbi:hypothetical protein KY289_032440 [Solanum tuberosum]|nr:hypothetical protein KY289_032440 [Solanum tuberosum]